MVLEAGKVRGGLTLQLQAEAGKVALVTLPSHTPSQFSPLSTPPQWVRPKPWGLFTLIPSSWGGAGQCCVVDFMQGDVV